MFHFYLHLTMIRLIISASVMVGIGAGVRDASGSTIYYTDSIRHCLSKQNSNHGPECIERDHS